MHIKNILYPTDFSPASRMGLDYTIAVAEKMHADIILMHSYEFEDEYSRVPAEQIIAMREPLKKEAEAKMRHLIREVGPTSPNVQLTYDLELGFFTEHIQEVIRKRKIDLIAIATQGAKGIESLLFGTNTGKVIDRSTCPVLVIPEGTMFHTMKHLVYLTEFKAGDLQRLRFLTPFAKALGAAIDLVNVSETGDNEPGEEFVESVREKVNYPLIHYRCIRGGNLLHCISRFAGEGSIDWIVMYVSSRNMFTRIFGRNLSKEMSYTTTVPLFVFPEHMNRVTDL